MSACCAVHRRGGTAQTRGVCDPVSAAHRSAALYAALRTGSNLDSVAPGSRRRHCPEGQSTGVPGALQHAAQERDRTHSEFRTIPCLQRIVPLRSTLRCARETIWIHNVKQPRLAGEPKYFARRAPKMRAVKEGRWTRREAPGALRPHLKRVASATRRNTLREAFRALAQGARLSALHRGICLALVVAR